jgi:hypothetical protein
LQFLFLSSKLPGAGGIISTIMNKQVKRTCSDQSEEAEIGFARKMIPEQSDHVLDMTLGTLLNGYAFP